MYHRRVPGGHEPDHRRAVWKRRSFLGALILSGVSVGVAQAVVSAPDVGRDTEGNSAASTAASLDTASLLMLNTSGANDLLRDNLLLDPLTGPTDTDPDVTAKPVVIRGTQKQRLAEVSSNTHYDVPQAALAAYRNAAIVLANTDPTCHISWPILAAIGQVESDQGRYGGAQVLSDGTTSPSIVGLPLNGVGNVAAIHDTDNGQLDGDTVWDRAVGPMQFIPSTWAVVGTDGDGDGIRDPNDFDDAALATAVYLCAGSGDLREAPAAGRAVYSYNHSSDYVTLVLSLAKQYADGVIDVVPSSDDPPTEPAPDPSQHHGDQGGDPPRHHHGQPDPRPRHPGGDQPAPNPEPEPSPSPAPEPVPKPEPQPITVTGMLSNDNSAWLVDKTLLEFGPDADLTVAQQDYDGDGLAEPVVDELTGLIRLEVRVRVGADGVVARVNGLPYLSPPPLQNPPPPIPPKPIPTTPVPTPTPTAPVPTEPTPTEPTLP